MSAAKENTGCAGFFAKMSPKQESELGSKLKPGVALPHITLPTTEVCWVSRGRLRFGDFF